MKLLKNIFMSKGELKLTKESVLLVDIESCYMESVETLWNYDLDLSMN
jgi:hypothetical protein